MPNVQISDLAFAITPLVGATTFFEVEATEGGVVVSRRVAADDLVISATTLFIDGTSTDDPAIAAGVFDGQLLWRNANAQQTGVFGFDPAGDNFIWSNDAEGGFHQIAIRDGTVLVETIAAAAGGLLAHNLLTGAGLERVLTTADITVTPALGGLTDVTLTAPATGAVLYKSAGDWLDTPGILIDPLADVKLHQNTVEVFRTVTAANGGAEANNAATGGGFERVLTTADLFAGVFVGTSIDDPTVPGGTFDANAQWQNANLLPLANVGFSPAGDTLYLASQVHGGKLVLRGEVAAGTIRDVYEVDFDAAELSHVWREPGGTQDLMRLDTGINAVTQKANSVNQPSGGFAQVGGFRVQNRNASPEVAMFVGFNETIGQTALELKNFVHGGPVQLVGETAAGLERVLFFIDPDQAGPQVFGLLDNDPTVDASIQDARMTFRNPSSTNIWQIGFLEGTNDFSIKLFQDTGILRLRGSNAANADTLLATFDPVADAKLFQAGVEVFRTDTAANGGAEANNTATGAGFERVLTTADLALATAGVSPFDIVSIAAANPTLTLTENVTLSTTLQHVAATDITILRNEIDSGHMELRGRTTLSADALFLTMDPDGGSQLFHNASAAGFRVIQTTNLGIDVYNDVLSATARTSFGLVHALTDEYMLNIEADPVTEVVEFLAGSDRRARLDIYATDTALNQVLMADLDAQAGPVRLYHSDAAGTTVITFRTVALASGGVEVNNTLTGAGFERVLTIADRTSAAVYTPTNVVTTRTYDANATSIDELADVLGTLIADLQAIDVIQ